MSRVFSAKDICERALRAIGAFPVTESAADGEQLREAMTWLDMILAEQVGTERMFSRVGLTMTMEITNGTQSYNLYTALGEDLPEDRIQYVTEAYLEDGSGNRTPVEIVNRERFEDVSTLVSTGSPTVIHIDRDTTSPTLRLYPYPPSTDTTEWVLKLVGQSYAPNVAPGGVTGTQPSGSVLHGMSQAWQRNLTFQLAHDLGSGPIFKIGEASLNRFGRAAGEAKARLLAFENREHETSAPVCEPWGM